MRSKANEKRAASLSNSRPEKLTNVLGISENNPTSDSGVRQAAVDRSITDSEQPETPRLFIPNNKQLEEDKCLVDEVLSQYADEKYSLHHPIWGRIPIDVIWEAMETEAKRRRREAKGGSK